MEMIKKQFSDNLQKFFSEDKWMIIQEDYKQEVDCTVNPVSLSKPYITKLVPEAAFCSGSKHSNSGND